MSDRYEIRVNGEPHLSVPTRPWALKLRDMLLANGEEVEVIDGDTGAVCEWGERKQSNGRARHRSYVDRRPRTLGGHQF